MIAEWIKLFFLLKIDLITYYLKKYLIKKIKYNLIIIELLKLNKIEYLFINFE